MKLRNGKTITITNTNKIKFKNSNIEFFKQKPLFCKPKKELKFYMEMIVNEKGKKGFKIFKNNPFCPGLYEKLEKEYYKHIKNKTIFRKILNNFRKKKCIDKKEDFTCLALLSELKNDAIKLTDIKNKKVWYFSQIFIKKMFENCLTNYDEEKGYCEPKNPKNPYNNEEFTINQNLELYNKINKKSTLIRIFKESNFNSRHVLNKHTSFILYISKQKYIKQLTKKEKLKKLKKCLVEFIGQSIYCLNCIEKNLDINIFNEVLTLNELLNEIDYSSACDIDHKIYIKLEGILMNNAHNYLRKKCKNRRRRRINNNCRNNNNSRRRTNSQNPTNLNTTNLNSRNIAQPQHTTNLNNGLGFRFRRRRQIILLDGSHIEIETPVLQ